MAATRRKPKAAEPPPAKVTSIRLTWRGGVHRFGMHAPARPMVAMRSQIDLHLDSLKAPFALVAPQLHDREHAILNRLLHGGWGLEDVERPVTLGLLHGGDFSVHEPVVAVSELVTPHVVNRPLAESVPLAMTVLMAAIYGVPPALAEAAITPEAFIAALEAAA